MKKHLLIILIASYFFTIKHSLLAQISPLILQQGSSSVEQTNSIALGTDKSIIISGIVNDSITLGVNTLNYTGSYISKYDSAGLNLWVIPAGNKQTWEEKIPAVAVDINNDIYILGKFDDTCHIGSTVLTSTGTENSFLAKLNSTGVVTWAKKLTNNSALLFDMNVDRFGNILLTGLLQNVLYLDNDSLIPQGLGDIVTIKLDNNGNLKWMKKAGGPGGYTEWGYSISSDYNGNVYVGGDLRSINPVFDGIVIPISGTAGYTGFIAKYDSSGFIVYAKKCGYENFSICSDSAGNVYACGYTYSAFAFDTTFVFGGSGTPKAFVASVSTTGNLQWAQLFYADYSNALAITSDNKGNCFVSGVSRDTTKIFGTNDTLILVNNINPQPNNCQFVVGFNNTGNPFWGNLIKNSNYAISSNDIDYLNCQLAFTGDFSSSSIYYNNDSIVSMGGTDGFVIVENAACDYILSNIINLNYSEEINPFPNPFTNELTIKLNDSKLTEVIIYDMFSRKLLSQLLTNSITLNTSQLAKGIYIYEVRNKSGVIKKGKVVKE